ncbi:hypothetical protein [Phaffia rhodozyma]|uniref:Uncharacterized protein n=1 Tax=Phaffia rhodozyma TaxID=264483 RepID=A0A0F7SKM5_PHARH|nr:hypothetical protein [Phaffia rhodozyma]
MGTSIHGPTPKARDEAFDAGLVKGHIYDRSTPRSTISALDDLDRPRSTVWIATEWCCAGVPREDRSAAGRQVIAKKDRSGDLNHRNHAGHDSSYLRMFREKEPDRRKSMKKAPERSLFRCRG